MKIAVWHNLPSGGGKRALYYHVGGLQARGHTVESWCPPTADQAYLPLSNLVAEHIVPFTWQPTSQRGPVAQLVAPYKDLVRKIQAMDNHCSQCTKQIINRGFDILFANSCVCFRVTSIGRQSDMPRLLYLQEPYRPLYEALPRLPWVAIPPPQRFWWSPRYRWWFLKDLAQVQGLRVQLREELQNARAFDRILVNSFFSRESVRRAYDLESRVCYLGVDTDLFQPTGESRDPFVIGLGTISYLKGLDRTIRALGTIDSSKRPNLVWVGNAASPTYQERVQKLASSLQVNLSIEVGVSDSALVELLSRASAMIYTPRLEPFGLAPLEANACQTPVVAIAEGGVRETIEDGVNGILVSEDNPEEVGEAILLLLERPHLAREMGARGRECVLNRWTWKAAVDRLEASLMDLRTPLEMANASNQ